MISARGYHLWLRGRYSSPSQAANCAGVAVRISPFFFFFFFTFFHFFFFFLSFYVYYVRPLCFDAASEKEKSILKLGNKFIIMIKLVNKQILINDKLKYYIDLIHRYFLFVHYFFLFRILALILFIYCC